MTDEHDDISVDFIGIIENKHGAVAVKMLLVAIFSHLGPDWKISEITGWIAMKC